MKKYKIKFHLTRKRKKKNYYLYVFKIFNKKKILASGPITAWQIEGEKVKVVMGFLLLGSKITADGYCSCEISR